MSRLHNGQPFPPLEVPAVGGGAISRVAVYSSDGIGRLVATDVAGLVSYLKSQQPA